MTDAEIENARDGLRNEGDVFQGLLSLSEQGQLNMKLVGERRGRRGPVIESISTKARLLRKRFEIGRSMGAFLEVATEVLKEHKRRFQR